ncbi:E3 ubiquitin-protein ligase LRSAM1-like [Mytilus galloprovincialis]|uniref:E3 ubiquitin-protein ligase LRSAM1-like n=1 Tax=Mytilus galloprovincialis TaxID=29158 RepID=UPI003F7B5BA4
MGHHVSKDKKRSSNNLTTPKGKKSAKKPGGLLSSSKGAGQPKGATQTSKTESSKKKMPFLRFQSSQAKKRYQDQMFEAENNPEPNIDVSNCELDEIPDDLYSACNYLQKEALLLNNNWLSGIDKPDRLNDFRTLRVLDLHHNEIKNLPENIHQLENLQVLNLENNKLSKLPSSIGKLRHLQTLNIKSNRLHSFPEEICNLKSLRMLDISGNKIVRLSKQFYKVRTLETLILDPEQMHYPLSDECCKGTEAIMIFICSDNQIEYLPPSNFLLDVLDIPTSPSKVSQSLAKHLRDEESLQKSVDDYNTQMDRKRQELADIERKMQQEETEQAEIAVKMNINRNKYLDEVVQDSDKMDKELEVISHKKDEERRKLLLELEKIENGVNRLIEDMMAENKRVKQVEQWIDELEEERMKDDDWCSVQYEEYQKLRKQEILENMQNLLNDINAQEALRLQNLGQKDETMKLALHSEEVASYQQVEDVLLNKEIGHTIVTDLYIQQEKAQRDAFEVLQLQKDARIQRITEQITMIEEELYNLTLVELEKRQMKATLEASLLEEKRHSLINMLEQLMEEQENRRMELKKRLIEMEQQKDDDETDYWLVQYQRLLDSKPQAVIDRERQLATDVVTILEDSRAGEYIPVFTRHRMTPETILDITDDELKQIGVHELGLRKAILKNISKYRGQRKLGSGKESAANLINKEKEAMLAEKGEHPQPTAPPTPTDETAQPFFRRSTSRQASILARGVNSECVVCMDNQSDVIFLKCGHVCTCQKCSEPLNQCPLCRGEIVSRIKLLSNPR